MVWNDKRPQGSGVSIDYHQRSSHNRCSQFTKPVRASNNNAGAWRGKTPSHFWFISFGHLANNSARSLFCEPIRIQGKYIHVAGSRRGKWVREGHHWFSLANQKTGSQFREPIRTRCKDILLVPSAGKCRRVVGYLWLVEKVLVLRTFCKADHNANQCKTKAWRLDRLKRVRRKNVIPSWFFLFVNSDFFCLSSFSGICFLLLVKILKRLILLDKMAG